MSKRTTYIAIFLKNYSEKTGDQVLEVLRAKHPEAWTPTAASLTTYTGCPLELTLVDITDSDCAIRDRKSSDSTITVM